MYLYRYFLIRNKASVYYTLYIMAIKVINDLIKIKLDQLKIDMYRSHSCNFHATHFIIDLCHLVMLILVIIDGFSYD